MNSSLILSVTTFVYGLAASLYLAAWVFHKKHLNRWATRVVMIGIAGNIAGFALRWIESYQMGIGRIPLSNLYVSILVFRWGHLSVFITSPEIMKALVRIW